jgi:HEAT repeat protein
MATPPLDNLRQLLDRLDGDDRDQQLAFLRAVLEAGPEAVHELDGWLPGTRAPKALRRLAMEASFYFPWPDWVPIHDRLLRYESDPEIFLTGARALGRVGTPKALTALRELNKMRQGGEFKEILAEVLARTDPKAAFDHYLEQLLKGGGHAVLANEAAQRLAELVDGDSLPVLKTVLMHPDLLVFRHAVMLLARVRTPEAAELLFDLLRESHAEVLADQDLKDALADLRSLAPAAAHERAADGLERFRAGADDPGGARARFFNEVQAATLDGRGGQLPALLAQAGEALHQRGRRLDFAVDAAAEGLAAMAALELIERGRVQDLLAAAHGAQTGREGVARALAQLVPAESVEILHQLLDNPDDAQRAAALEALGGRVEPALTPILLRACRDPLTDIGERARHYIGQLPGAEALARNLLGASGAGDFELGLRLAAEHRLRGLVPDLLALLEGSTREDLSVRLVEALGAIGAPGAAGLLLELLHSGQSLRLQMAIGQALSAMATPEVARALGAKADELKLPALHLCAVEALAGGGRSLPADAGQGLLDHVRSAWNDRNPWAVRLRLVRLLQDTHLAAPAIWSALAIQLNDALNEKRAPGAWSNDDLHFAQAAAREFQRRGA